MEKIKQFLKETKRKSKILFLLWLIFSIFQFLRIEDDGRLSVVFNYGVLFLFPAIMIELRNNSTYDTSKFRIIYLLKRRKTSSIFLFYLWVVTSFIIMGGLEFNIYDNIDELIISGFIFGVPILIIEYLIKGKENKIITIDEDSSSVENDGGSLKNQNTNLEGNDIESSKIINDEIVICCNNKINKLTNKNFIYKIFLNLVVAIIVYKFGSIVNYHMTGNKDYGNLSIAIIFCIISSYLLITSLVHLAIIVFKAVKSGKNSIVKEGGDDTNVHNIKNEEGDVKDISLIDRMNGHEFEYFCANLLKKKGFSKVRVTKGSGDQGVDVLATKNGIMYAVQCKNYASPLSNRPIQEVHAGKTFYNCHVGVVMTNSTFTNGAKALAKTTGVLLWDRSTLQNMMESKR